MIRRVMLQLVVIGLVVGVGLATSAQAAPCLIFVHGKQTDTNTFTNYASARAYWQNGSHDFIQTATKQRFDVSVLTSELDGIIHVLTDIRECGEMEYCVCY